MLIYRDVLAAALVLISALVPSPSLAETAIFVRASASGTASQSYTLGVSYSSPSGLSVQDTGPLNGTTASFSPTSAVTGLTAISLAAAVNGSASGSSAASADLGTGIVKAIAKSDTFGSGGIGFAEVADDLTFAVAGGGSEQIAIISHLDGSIGAFTTTGSFSGLSYILNFGTTSNIIYVSQGSQNGFVFSVTGASGPTPSGWDSYTVSNVTATGFDFTGLLTISDGELRTVTQRLSLNCQEGVDCDFSHTGSIALQLPPGVSFTSGSGVFLTSPTTVPVPASWAMLVSGLGFGGSVARRRRTLADGQRRLEAARE